MKNGRGNFCRAHLLLGVAFGLVSPALAQTNESEFSHRMAERFRQALPGRAVEISGPLQLRVGNDADGATVNLNRPFNNCRQATPQECETDISEFVARLVESLEDRGAPITRAQLRVAVRATEYCDYISDQLGRGNDGPQAVMRPFVAGLCVVVMADYPTTMRAVTSEDLRQLDLEADAAWTLAERQTHADLPRPDSLDGLQESLAAVSGYDYVTSLLLNAEGWRAAAAAHGELIAAVPASDTLIVARLANIQDMERLKAVVRQHFEEAGLGVSPLIYRWTGSGWVPVQ